ncbi:MAG: hypothetical protein ABWY93_17640 [Mycobacterium sp.]
MAARRSTRKCRNLLLRRHQWRTRPIASGSTAEAHHLRGDTVAKADTAIAAARLLLFDAAAALQPSAERGDDVTMGQRASFRAAMSRAAEVSREALTAIYGVACSSATGAVRSSECLRRDGGVVARQPIAPLP